MTSRWTRYVALGDSFTEGMVDPDPSGPTPADADPQRGWADRLADRLAAQNAAQDADENATENAGENAGETAGGTVGLEYANLAVRGRLLRQILDEQVPLALAAEPDLVSIVGGGNDVLRPGSDPDALADELEAAVAQIRAGGSDVLLCTPMDPRESPLIRLTRGKAAVFDAHIWSMAQRQGAHVMDLWGTRALRDWRFWAPDRIHLNSDGHSRVADLAAASLGLEVDDAWSVPLPPQAAAPWRQNAREQAVWARQYVAPWVRRRLRGRSSGDGRAAKRPVPLPLVPPPG